MLRFPHRDHLFYLIEPNFIKKNDKSDIKYSGKKASKNMR